MKVRLAEFIRRIGGLGGQFVLNFRGKNGWFDIARHKLAISHFGGRKFILISSKKADIKCTTLMRVENGTVNKPNIQTVAKIAKALGVLIEELIK